MSPTTSCSLSDGGPLVELPLLIYYWINRLQLEKATEEKPIGRLLNSYQQAAYLRISSGVGYVPICDRTCYTRPLHPPHDQQHLSLSRPVRHLHQAHNCAGCLSGSVRSMIE
ncbi:hypothetical protein L202_07764 [Cryptococcus amylolentus CBS 6039]|uniref:Uncharacterized protein n=1 Tax=Cryptococcus amylolentus CBS 6039 TaxID=1295533 RepID=A0A1E3HAM3_9TREE|nr:hypothetical protein L202_07764 [Cryptococcus amylolentus CBS 6039]ODN73205.1 hypothetical protein L202_07764 [Cryptococcus amylolentus CBS 6039]